MGVQDVQVVVPRWGSPAAMETKQLTECLPTHDMPTCGVAPALYRQYRHKPSAVDKAIPLIVVAGAHAMPLIWLRLPPVESASPVLSPFASASAGPSSLCRKLCAACQ